MSVRVFEFKKYCMTQLTPYSESFKLDTELLMMYILKKSRTELLVDEQEHLSSFQENELKTLVQRRIDGEPIAYLIQSQPFWTMDLTVTKDTLIPRPETECLIDYVLNKFDPKETIKCADLGTGTGAIAIAIALEKPHWKIHATDLSENALIVAKKNAKKYNINNISFFQGDWFLALPPQKYDFIISNPPYISENDPHLTALKYEPLSALVSGKKGLNALAEIISTAKNYLKKNAFLLVEHGYNQSEDVYQLFQKAGYSNIETHTDLAGVPRFMTGVKSEV